MINDKEDTTLPEAAAQASPVKSGSVTKASFGGAGKTSLQHRIGEPGFWNPYRIILTFFFGLIIAGYGLLLLPISTNSGRSPELLTAMFTSTSAVCVTGLVVVDAVTYWSGFGQVIILLLMQLGGLGFASTSVLFLVALDQRLDLNERMVLKSAIGSVSRGSVLKLSLFILSVTLACEAIGAGFFFRLGWATRAS